MMKTILRMTMKITRMARGLGTIVTAGAKSNMTRKMITRTLVCRTTKTTMMMRTMEIR